MKLLVSFALCQVPFGTRMFYSESAAIWRGEGVCGFVSESSKVTMCGVALGRGESDCSDEVIFHATAGTEIVLSGCVLARMLTELSSDKYSHAPTLLLCLTTLGDKQLVSNIVWRIHRIIVTSFFLPKEISQEHLLNLDRWVLPENCSQRKEASGLKTYSKLRQKIKKAWAVCLKCFFCYCVYPFSICWTFNWIESVIMYYFCVLFILAS